MKTAILLTVLFAVVCVAAHAHLGETEEQANRRFGHDPQHTAAPPASEQTTQTKLAKDLTEPTEVAAKRAELAAYEAAFKSKLSGASDLPNTLTVDGQTYEEVRWTNATPITVTIFHKTGIATIPLEKLTPDLQRRLGYDSERATAYRQVRTELLALLQRQQEQARQEAEKRREQMAQVVKQRQEEEQQRQAEAAAKQAERAACRSFVATFIKQPGNWFHMGAYWRVISETDSTGKWHPADRVIYLMPAVDLAYGDRSTFSAKYLGEDLHDTGNGIKQRIERWSICDH